MPPKVGVALAVLTNPILDCKARLANIEVPFEPGPRLLRRRFKFDHIKVLHRHVPIHGVAITTKTFAEGFGRGLNLGILCWLDERVVAASGLGVSGHQFIEGIDHPHSLCTAGFLHPAIKFMTGPPRERLHDHSRPISTTARLPGGICLEDTEPDAGCAWRYRRGKTHTAMIFIAGALNIRRVSRLGCG